MEECYAPDYHEKMTGGRDANRRSRAYRKENEIRVADLQRHLARGKVLDVGCSRGDFAQAMSRAGFDVHGLDIAPEACGEARKLIGAERVYCESLENLASRMPQQFSAVTLMDVIEHCTDVVTFLGAAHQLLEPSGILFLRTPTLSSPFHVLGTLSYRLSLGLYKTALFKLYHAEHLYFFNERGMRRLLFECGFDTLQVSPDPLCWANFRTAEMRQGPIGNLALAATYFAGRAFGRGHGMKVVARRRNAPRNGEGST
jgi:2-polyprenyl-3-methyl-5-hydroxy-6-metoxy-1,4-benzoquinol methylase